MNRLFFFFSVDWSIVSKLKIITSLLLFQEKFLSMEKIREFDVSGRDLLELHAASAVAATLLSILLPFLHLTLLS